MEQTENSGEERSSEIGRVLRLKGNEHTPVGLVKDFKEREFRVTQIREDPDSICTSKAFIWLH